MLKIIRNFFFLTLSIGILSSCEQESAKELGLLPSAKGQSGEIILVMDSTQWNANLGEEIKKVFLERLSGLPQPEAMFTVRQIEPSKFNSFLKHHKNIVLVTTFDKQTPGSQYMRQFFTPESIEQIKGDTSIFMTNLKDQYAKGQHVMSLYGKNEQALISHLQRRRTQIQDIFNQVERERTIVKFQKARKRELEKSLASRHQFNIQLPNGYRLAKDSANFVWLRFPEVGVDKNLFITHKPYTSEDDFSRDSIIAWRNEITRKHTKDPDNPEYYVITVEEVEPTDRKVNFGGKFAVEMRGLWRLQYRYVGGAFLSYVIVDEKTNRMYYIEGFLSAPGGMKREHMREIEAVLRTFQA